MAEKDIATKVRAVLQADTTLTAMLTSSNDIRVSELPVSKVNKQITIRQTLGRSDSILHATMSTLFIFVWVKQKEVSEPYKTTAQIMRRVVALLNRQGRSLDDSPLEIHQIVKTDGQIMFDEDQERWIGTLVFDVVTNE